MSPPVDAMTVVLKITGLSHPENVPERLLNRVRKVMR